MTHTLICISLALTTVFAAVLSVGNRRLRKELKKENASLASKKETIDAMWKYSCDRRDSLARKVEVEERRDSLCFALYRQGRRDKYDVLIVRYNPHDPGDREYKQLHAQEVADKLNEEP